jgi:hypothetical protein
MQFKLSTAVDLSPLPSDALPSLILHQRREPPIQTAKIFPLASEDTFRIGAMSFTSVRRKNAQTWALIDGMSHFELPSELLIEATGRTMTALQYISTLPPIPTDMRGVDDNPEGVRFEANIARQLVLGAQHISLNTLVVMPTWVTWS